MNRPGEISDDTPDSIASSSMIGFSGKCVLVTGASTGIGAAAAGAFARQGASVAIHFNASEEAAACVRDTIVAQGGRAVLVRADLSQPAYGAELVAEAVDLLGGLDVLVNNAGSLTGRTPFME